MDLTTPFRREARNDVREFDGLVRKCHRQAYNIAYRLAGNHADAEDLTQEAFIRAYRFFDRYNREMPFENWLYRIISNAFIDSVRRRPKARLQSLDQPIMRNGVETQVYLELPDESANPEGQIMEREIDEPLQRALSTLPHDFRQAVVLADIEGLSYEEISETMGCSLGTVRSRLHRGRKALRAALGPGFTRRSIGALP